MIQLSFTAEDTEQIHYYRFHHPHPRVQRKMEALYLKSQQYPHKEIAKLIRVTEPTGCLTHLSETLIFREIGIDPAR